jgi:hypothetical protein
MPRAIATYIAAADLPSEQPSYRWDDDVEQEVLFSQPRIADRISKMSYRAALAVALGSIEWTIYRLKPQLASDEPFQFVDAAWAALVDWLYLKSFDLPDWDEYEVAVGGPLQHSFWLMKECFVAARKLKPFNDFTVSISEVSLRVCGRRDVFKAWRRSIVQRMVTVYPENPNDLCGRPVPRDALDLAYAPSPTADDDRIAHYLASLDWKSNKFLRSPEEMQKAGFAGTPYSPNMSGLLPAE